MGSDKMTGLHESRDHMGITDPQARGNKEMVKMLVFLDFRGIHKPFEGLISRCQAAKVAHFSSFRQLGTHTNSSIRYGDWVPMDAY